MKFKKAPWVRPETNNFVISIITAPIPDGSDRNMQKIRAKLKYAKRIVLSIFKPLPAYLKSAFGGHHAVTRSLVEGLEKLNVPFSYNPVLIEDLSRTVIVLSDAFALKQMIALKQQGYIKYLLAGPNILNDPSSHDGILSSPEVDVCITPCEIVCKLHERFLPSLKNRSLPWAAGVDADFWKPRADVIRNKVLIYNKQSKGPTTPPDKYIQELEKRGYNVSVVNYGYYSVDEFLLHLQTATLLIGFSRDESQGIAWTEAWACDVPTFIWYNSEPTYLGVQYNGSPAPYLSETTGSYFSSLDDLVSLLNRWENKDLRLSPRQWCLENMTDEVCAKELLRICKII